MVFSRLKFFVFVFLFNVTTAAFSADQDYLVDMVIFSFDRPLQLYALLESAAKYITGNGEVHIIYRASNEQYDNGYQMVQRDFSGAIYHKQGNNPRQDFKPLTLDATFKSPHAFVVFAVDDIIVKDYIDLRDCALLLQKTDAYGFYLRLGKNLNYCYSLSRSQPLPPLHAIFDDVYSWQISTGSGDWGYPNSVDMTVVRKSDIKGWFSAMQYHHPNTLEAAWSRKTHAVQHRCGLCYGQSKIVNLPLNRVQHEYQNRCMDVPPHELLATFMQGLKIDINPLFKIQNKSAHMEYGLTFIER